MKRLNTWLMSIWGMIVGWFVTFPQDLNNLWSVMPDEIKSAIPPSYAKGIAFALFCSMVIGRNVANRKEKKQLEQKVEEVTKDDGAN